MLLSITKSCETLVEQTRRKAEETLKLKMTKPRETFLFNPPIQVKEDWMLGSVDLEVYNYIFIITEEINKFEFYKYPDGKSVSVSSGRVKNEIEEDLYISDITATDLQDELLSIY